MGVVVSALTRSSPTGLMAAVVTTPARPTSLAPAQTFNGLVGTSVGHCDVPSAARPYVLELVGAGSTSTTLPPSVPVSP